MFPNPVNGPIHAKGWTRPAGNVEFVVTRTSADHVATNQGKGLDISSKRCNVDPVLAMGAGKIVIRDATQGILVVDHGNGWRTHYAHMRNLRYSVGATVASRATLGMVSDAHDPSITNFAGCHLHFGITKLVSGAWVAQDPWPLLDQNATGGDMTVKTNELPFIGPDGKPANATVSFQAGKTVTGYALDGTSEKYTAPAGGSSAPADARVAIFQNPRKAPQGGYDTAGNAVISRPFLRVPLGVFADHPYIAEAAHVSAGAILVTEPKPPTGGGFTQADLDAAKAAGKAQGVAETDALWEQWNATAQGSKP